jgi:hypothetical protein
LKRNARVCCPIQSIATAFTKHGFGSLGLVVESVGGRYDYGQCRVVCAAMQLG